MALPAVEAARFLMESHCGIGRVPRRSRRLLWRSVDGTSRFHEIFCRWRGGGARRRPLAGAHLGRAARRSADAGAGSRGRRGDAEPISSGRRSKRPIGITAAASGGRAGVAASTGATIGRATGAAAAAIITERAPEQALVARSTNACSEPLVRSPARLTRSRCSAWSSRARPAAAARPSATARSRSDRASGRRPYSRRAAGG